MVQVSGRAVVRVGGNMSKHRVTVWLRAEAEVEIEVECEEGLDPADLTPEEQREATLKAQRLGTPTWEIHRAREVTP
jgi:hypothetical protein